MIHILSYGVSLPRFQIEGRVLHPKRGKNAGKRTVVFADEDPVTLAFDAASGCLAHAAEGGHAPGDIDAILFATTTPVFGDRYHASFLAELLELPSGVLAMDLSASPRAGTDALLLAHHLLHTDRFHNVLVLAAEAFFPPVGEELTPTGREGHAGGALWIGDREGVASLRAARSYGGFIAEAFTYRGRPVQVDARFGREAGIKTNLALALDRFFETEACNPADFDTVVLNALDAKSGAALFKKRGFDTARLSRDPLLPQTGLTGVCHALNLLIYHLERNAGDILLADYWNGANLVHLTRTRRAHSSRDSFEAPLKGAVPVETYQDYLALRKAAAAAGDAGTTGNGGAPPAQEQDVFSSDMMLEREKKHLLHLNGFACSRCGTVYYLKTQRCKRCKGETFSLKKLARRGTVFSFTKEHYFPASFPPTTMAVVDLDGGGRLTLQLTDEMYPRESDAGLIGTEVELVLRKRMERDAKPNYFWKCRRTV